MEEGGAMTKPGQFGLLPDFDLAPLEDSQERRYAEYIRSPAWRQLRYQALEAAGYQCQRCGISKWSATLEVHHLTYERFRQERPADLVVLCESCHQKADLGRRVQVKLKNAKALKDARLDGWASKIYGDDWRDWCDSERVVEQYENWLKRYES